jgi:uncharacterized protein (TIGR00106 family)
MLAQFTVHPLDETHLSKDVAQMIEILDEESVAYSLGPLGTAVEGNWNEVMSAIRRCHEEMLKRHARVITTVTVDDRREMRHHLHEIVPVVEQQLGRKAKPRKTLQTVRDLE